MYTSWIRQNLHWMENLTVLLRNCFVVMLDKIGRPVKFGAPKKEAAK